MTNDLRFDEWVEHIFGHPVSHPRWYSSNYHETWNGEPHITVEYLTRLFRSPERLLKDYSPEQLEQGLWYVVNEGEPFMYDLLDKSVPWLLRQRGLTAIRVFFEKFFAIACTDEMGHLCRTASTPINNACYMWWDLFPCWGHPEDPARRDEDQTILQVLKGILEIPSEACRESALHGLGHWQPQYPEVVRKHVDDFLNKSPAISDPLREYAVAARSGRVL